MKACEAIREIMDENDVSFMELARRTRMASNTLANQLSDKRNLSLNKFDRLLIALGYKIVIIPGDDATPLHGMEITGNQYAGKERKI